jgi:2-amino-4-hydroxy-6-hydroxymethyldihydropteridine diphosphokinase
MDAKTVYIALGSNLGDRQANLAEAIRQLEAQVVVEQISAVYETEPAYVTAQPRFYNMVLRGSTRLAPDELLSFLKRIEQQLGRGQTERYGPRPIDLDILVYGNLQLKKPELTIPHPLIAERAFVLAPFAEISPDLVFPGQQVSVSTLLQQLGNEGQGRIVKVVQK